MHTLPSSRLTSPTECEVGTSRRISMHVPPLSSTTAKPRSPIPEPRETGIEMSEDDLVVNGVWLAWPDEWNAVAHFYHPSSLSSIVKVRSRKWEETRIRECGGGFGQMIMDFGVCLVLVDLPPDLKNGEGRRGVIRSMIPRRWAGDPLRFLLNQKSAV
ncbi:uncharacterized protein B0I36DRAFT_313056 [Microdochium trichocladiopsis]|uniref:Uncharacterized protein n=1 Tax=Microdochium trichocladiopsis TaxID=1682393 RepID=A0A9P9BX85_9PEZI|nr:uncharacterized protein B0I36DRAFT_313056 [Microdochium trichocladiopsis]KAH7041577.1 hypothetical protein B0I36DRAFT_313056 [Microdochium trichocladiopsis]